MGILHHNELIAILLRSGIPGKSAIELADEVLHLRDSLTKLSTISLAELMSIKGIKQAKALEILACFELSKRMALAEVEGTDDLGQELSVDKTCNVPKLFVQLKRKPYEIFLFSLFL